MRLATIRTPTGTQAARVEGERVILLEVADVGDVLRWGDPSAVPEAGVELSLDSCDLAPVVPRPGKILCVGLNYQAHIAEIGIPTPEYPTLFAKFASSLIGAHDDLVLPSVSDYVDWEVELAVVVGRHTFRASQDEALAAIGGYTVANDVSMRDWQFRTKEWLQGKAFDASTPVGPVMVTPDEVDHAAALEIRCAVDGRVVQSSNTKDLLFRPAQLIAYISEFVSLDPGDLVLTGTPSGVGHMSGDRLEAGQVLTTSVEGIGVCANRTVPEP